MKSYSLNKWIHLLVLTSIAMGCATSQAFKEKEMLTQSKIHTAAQAGAKQVPSAYFYLKLAKEELEKAKNLSAQHKEQANFYLLRAEADADLAVALAQEEKEKTEAAEFKARVHQLKQDNQIPAGGVHQ